MAIRTGDRAVPFTLPCKPGETVDLSEHIGRAPVVLLFFPLSFSPVCTDEMCHVRDTWGEWESLDARVFGVTVDSPFVTDRFRAEERIPFPLLSDFNREMATAWGALHEDLKGLKGVPKRAAFVIAPDGTVAYDWVSEDPGQMPDFGAVKAALQGAASRA